MARKLVTNIIVSAALMLCLSACSSPESDGKKAAQNFIEAQKEFVQNVNSSALRFIETFDDCQFTTRVEARQKLQEIVEKANADYEKNRQKAQQNYNKLAGKYVKNYEKSAKFQSAYNSQKQQYQNQNLADETTAQLQSQIDNLILTVIPPKPDGEKLKKDLLGREIVRQWDGYKQTRKFKIETPDQIVDLQIRKNESIDANNMLMEVYLELNSPVSVYQIEMMVNYLLGTRDEWAIELVQVKSFETKVTGKYSACIKHAFCNGGFMTKAISLTNNCDVPLLVEGILMTDYQKEWLPFEELIEPNSEAIVARWGSVQYVGSVVDYKIQKIERP